MSHGHETQDAAAQDAPRLFSKQKPIKIKPFWRECPDGERIELRWPTDAEWIEANSKIVSLTQPAGRGATETRITGDIEAAELLVNKVLTNGARVDRVDAVEIYELLADRDATLIERGGRSAKIGCRIIGGIETAHHLRIPSKLEWREYSRAAVKVVDMARNISRTGLDAARAGELYDKILIEVEGYESRADIPIIHKGTVINELQLVSAEISRAGDDAVFFG